MLQACEMEERTERSKIPLGVGEKVEFIEMLLRYESTKWLEKGAIPFKTLGSLLHGRDVNKYDFIRDGIGIQKFHKSQ